MILERDEVLLFPGFRALDVRTHETTIRLRVGGSGAPLVLLHGYPQTHVMWHKVASRLQQHFTLICPDLRGYGDSGKPPSDHRHATYSKRAMAADVVDAMRALGFERFSVAGHDRGGRVAHRLALDHPSKVQRLAVLDIAPTREMYRDTTDAFARAYWHWFFLIQPSPFPERLIGADPEGYWLKKCGSGSAGLAPFSKAALAEYLRCFSNPATIQASCEDYRAAATIDIEHDNEDAGRKLTQPLLVLWGELGVIHRCFRPLDLWRERAHDVRGRALAGGHYLAEELPDDVSAALVGFFGEQTS